MITDDEICAATNFQERFFKSEIVRAKQAQFKTGTCSLINNFHLLNSFEHPSALGAAKIALKI